MQTSQPIGIFDSGIGGLSILKEVKKTLPGESIIFFADQVNLPYGAKTPKQIKSIAKSAAQFLISKNAKLLIVACNTATCYSLSYLRSQFKLPIIGVVPAIKPAAALTNKSKIAIMSTQATARSPYLKNLIAKNAKGAEILILECPGLADAIEKSDHAKINLLLSRYAGSLKNFGADVLVLGSTHYTLVKGKIKQIFGSGLVIIDSSAAVARQVGQIINKTNSPVSPTNEDLFFTTGNANSFSKIASSILKTNILAASVKLL